jgi:hypothetical protein
MVGIPSKGNNIKLCFFILLTLNFALKAQTKPSFTLSSKQFVSRTGYFGGLSTGMTLGRLEIEAETGVHLLRLFQYGHYAPYVGMQVNLELMQKEKMSVLTGVDYMMTLRRFPYNTASNAHSIFYQYKLVYGEKWQFVQELGVGGTVINRFPESNQLLWDVKLLIGVSYAF